MPERRRPPGPWGLQGGPGDCTQRGIMGGQRTTGLPCPNTHESPASMVRSISEDCAAGIQRAGLGERGIAERGGAARSSSLGSSMKAESVARQAPMPAKEQMMRGLRPARSIRKAATMVKAARGRGQEHWAG